MIDYKTMYFTLFNAITDAIRSLDGTKWGDYQSKATRISDKLKEAQLLTEEMYMDSPSDEDECTPEDDLDFES